VTRAWIAFGANLGERAAALERVGSLLAARGITIRRRSRLYASRPENGADEPEYGNAVFDTETALDAHSLLGALQSVEEELGRPRAHATGPRTCDLDLLAFDDLVVDEEGGLVLPHPRLHRRAFVLVPLVELDPRWRHPASGVTAGEMLAALPAAPGEVWRFEDAARPTGAQEATRPDQD
jgi:2-amino-4-hydroxy-6-hydroxymethyldihydropteridine diphosphokinase